MKRIRCYDYELEENDKLFKEIDKILCKENYDVEVFGVSAFDKELPLDFEICDYDSRETLCICENNNIITDKMEIEKIEHQITIKDE